LSKLGLFGSDVERKRNRNEEDDEDDGEKVVFGTPSRMTLSSSFPFILYGFFLKVISIFLSLSLFRYTGKTLERERERKRKRVDI